MKFEMMMHEFRTRQELRSVFPAADKELHRWKNFFKKEIDRNNSSCYTLNKSSGTMVPELPFRSVPLTII
jgi:hypothetical protein